MLELTYFQYSWLICLFTILGDTECETLEPFSPGMFLNDDVDSHVDTVDNTQPDTEWDMWNFLWRRLLDFVHIYVCMNF